MIAGRTRREILWPADGRFPAHGAVGLVVDLDRHLVDAATAAGAEIVWETEALPTFDDSGRIDGVSARGQRWPADLVVAATGAPGTVARMLGAERVSEEPFGLAIRTYAETPRHDDRHLEACLTLKNDTGTWVPGMGDVPGR